MAIHDQAACRRAAPARIATGFAARLFALTLATACGTPDEAGIEALHRKFRADPEQSKLANFLRAESDGATRYRHRALVAAALVEHPDPFRDFLESDDGAPPEILIEVFRLREQSFEYFPESKPAGFSDKLDEYYADWVF